MMTQRIDFFGLSTRSYNLSIKTSAQNSIKNLWISSLENGEIYEGDLLSLFLLVPHFQFLVRPKNFNGSEINIVSNMQFRLPFLT